MTVCQQELWENGYEVVPRLIPSDIMDRLAATYSPDYLDRQPRELRSRHGFFHYLDLDDPATQQLLTLPMLHRRLCDSGQVRDLRLHSGYVVAKKPGDASLHWHRDINYPWDKPEPPELFTIFYLGPTTQTNGCLRVLPRSHMIRTPTHDHIGSEHPPLTAWQAGEVSLEMAVGDVFVGDRRLLHATHANTTAQWRCALTISWVLDYAGLPQPLQRLVADNPSLSAARQRRDYLPPGVQRLVVPADRKTSVQAT